MGRAENGSQGGKPTFLHGRGQQMGKTLPLGDFQRGLMAGQRYDAVQQSPDGWKAILKTGGWAWILDEVSSAYLDGLQAVGCPVVLLRNLPRMAA
jgi:hypothetical protein